MTPTKETVDADADWLEQAFKRHFTMLARTGQRELLNELRKIYRCSKE